MFKYKLTKISPPRKVNKTHATIQNANQVHFMIKSTILINISLFRICSYHIVLISHMGHKTKQTNVEERGSEGTGIINKIKKNLTKRNQFVQTVS